MPEHAEPAPRRPAGYATASRATGPGLRSASCWRSEVPVTPGVVLASQERVGNQATTKWLQRSVFDDVLPDVVTDATRESRILAAARFIDNPVHYKLTMHYGYEQRGVVHAHRRRPQR